MTNPVKPARRGLAMMQALKTNQKAKAAAKSGDN